MYGSQYVTNQFHVWIPVRGLLTNLRKMLATKFISSSHDEDHETPWLQNPTVYKHNSFFKRKTKANSVSGHSLHEHNFVSHLHNLLQPLKQSLYMFRVLRRKLKHVFMDWSEINSEKLISINLNR